MKKHARLRASSSYRWIRCAGSVKAEENLPDTTNEYAAEGILAHEIAARLLNKESVDDYEITEEMLENINLYIDYVHQITRKDLYYPEVLIEKQVDFSHIIPEEFGTADTIVIETNHLHIIDFKYGVGLVNAYENSQLLLYAIGAYNNLQNNFLIENISLHIVQPRINNFDKWTISPKELKFYEGYIKAKGEEALRENAPRIPSELACKWCKANSTCPALFNLTNTVVIPEEKTTLTHEEIKTILDKSKLIKNFLTSLENNVFETLKSGNNFPGYKLIEGRNIRKLLPNIDDKLFELLGEKAYIKTPVGVTELDKMLDKETLKSLVYLSKTKPLLVSVNDKRETLKLEELNFDPVIEEDFLS